MVLRSAVKGFVEGVGVDGITWMASGYVPGLAKPSPIKIPGYDPAGVRYDDLISLGVSLGFVVLGAAKRDIKSITRGATMALGCFVLSKHQPGPPIPVLRARSR